MGFYTQYATSSVNLFCSFFSILPTLCTDIISVKGLGRENCSASAVDRYFPFTALEKCSTIRLFRQYSFRLKQLSILQAVLELKKSLKIILVPENIVKRIKI